MRTVSTRNGTSSVTNIRTDRSASTRRGLACGESTLDEHLARGADPSEDQVGDGGGIRVVESTVVGILDREFSVVADEEVGQDGVVRSPLLGHVGQRGECLGDLGVCVHSFLQPAATSSPVIISDSTRAMSRDGDEPLPPSGTRATLLEVTGEPLTEVVGGEQREQREVLALHVVLEVLGHRA